MSQPGVLIIGYGSPLRGDDGVGMRAADLLREASWPPGERPEIVACHQLTPELAEPVSRAGRVVFIDAACDDDPGTITCRPIAPEVPGPAAFTHLAGPAALLAAARRWYGRSPEAVLCSVGGKDFGLAEQLSPAVSAALPALIDQVLEAAAGVPCASGSHP